LVVPWKQQHEQRGVAGASRPQFTGCGVAALREQETRVKKLEGELEITRQERDTLKKALAFLSKTAHMRTPARFFAKKNDLPIYRAASS